MIPALTSRAVTAIADRLFNCGVPIFMLHRIQQPDELNTGKTTSAHLRSCLNYLIKQNYTFIALKDLILTLKKNKKLPIKSVVFTMDDGYADQAEIAAPIFLEYNCPITFFVITGMLDQTSWPWDAKVSWIIESSTDSSLKHSATIKGLNLNLNNTPSKRKIRQSIQNALKEVDTSVAHDILQQLADDADVTIPNKAPLSYQPMTWNLARQLEDRGICFAPHSVNHNILSRLSQKTMEHEILDAWQRINNELKNPLKVFCYPNGKHIDFGDREINTIKNNGYLSAVSTIPGFVRDENSIGDKIYSLPRLALPDNMTDFVKYCSWVESVRDSLFKVKN